MGRLYSLLFLLISASSFAAETGKIGLWLSFPASNTERLRSDYVDTSIFGQKNQNSTLAGFTPIEREKLPTLGIEDNRVGAWDKSKMMWMFSDEVGFGRTNRDSLLRGIGLQYKVGKDLIVSGSVIRHPDTSKRITVLSLEWHF